MASLVPVPTPRVGLKGCRRGASPWARQNVPRHRSVFIQRLDRLDGPASAVGGGPMRTGSNRRPGEEVDELVNEMKLEQELMGLRAERRLS